MPARAPTLPDRVPAVARVAMVARVAVVTMVAMVVRIFTGFAMAAMAAVVLVAAGGCSAPRGSPTGSSREPAPTRPANSDPLELLHLRESAGAAAGYVADSGCRTCHREKFDSYQDVGMAQSMRRPANARRIESFDAPEFVHEPSREHYAMRWRDGEQVFQRWQVDERGERINEIEQRVDWVVGSGHRARVYLYATPDGALFQLPLAWYSQEGSWGMAPGYDRADHDGVMRPIRRECLFCHDAYPSVPAGSDAHWSPQVFPSDMPEGTGCQRCHGPGAGHVRSVLGGRPADEIRAAIVNPRRLPPDRRDDVCFQCHLLPAVALIGPRRFERGDYSFRPGEPLSDYILHVDVVERGRDPDDRFEINHHGYRLMKSACYRKGGVTCIDCHDPHRSLSTDDRLARVNTTCAGCHRPHDAQPAPPGLQRAVAAGDCVGCHMQRRRTEDVVHVTMTDHWIRKRMPPDTTATPLREREPDIASVRFLDAKSVPPGPSGNAYRAVTVLRAGVGGDDVVAQLERALATRSTHPGSATPWLDIAARQLSTRRFGDAQSTLDRLSSMQGNSDPLLASWRGLAQLGLGHRDAAVSELQAAVAQAPDNAEYRFNLGLALHRRGDSQPAIEAFSRAIALRPNMAAAWLARGDALANAGRNVEAVADLEQALRIDPRRPRAYAALEKVLRAIGRTDDAERYRAVGERITGAKGGPGTEPTP